MVLGSALIVACTITTPLGDLASGSRRQDAGPDALTADAGSGVGPGADAGFATDGDACPFDRSTDSKSCGVCGHDCLGGECHSGVCQPVVLEYGQGGAFGIAVDDTAVYWANYADGRVMKRAKDGSGTSLELAKTASPGPRDITVDPSNVYFTNNNASASAVYRVKKDGAGLSALPGSGCDGARGIAVLGAFVYIACHDSNTIAREPADGGGALATIASAQGDADQVFGYGDLIFWTTGASPERS